jgi:hypothetical protein
MAGDMTISKELRREQIVLCLRRMLARVGDDDFLETTMFDVTDPAFADLLRTTWIELLELGLVQRDRVTAERYLLTHAGWITALKITGLINDPALLERCQILVRTLKASVKGRDHGRDALLSDHELAAATRLPMPWLFNAMKARLLREMFPKDKMNARWDSNSRCFRVPQTFGMDVL